MNISKFIEELKRRNVVRVATAYAIAGWLIIQVFDIIAPQLGFPEWIAPLVTILVLIGLPISLIIAWAFELTPQGLKTTKEVDQDESITHNTGKKLNGLIIGGLCLLVAFLIVERVFFATSGVNDEAIPVSTISDKSIAVLPFDDFNAGGDQEYFADGLTEEILNSLAKTPDLLVASRTSSFQYKDRNVDIIRIADTLGVAHILEGSVRESSDKYRITAQLIRASDGFHLWSETYDRPKTDIIDIQEEIAFQIATALETAMDPNALKEMLKVGTTSIEAYRYYVEGLSLNTSIDSASYNKAAEYFELARKLDPNFAEAHFRSAQIWKYNLEVTNMSSAILEGSYSDKLRAFNERIDLAILHANEIDKLYYVAVKAFSNLEYRKSIDYFEQYINLRPNSDLYYDLLVSTSYIGEYELGYSYLEQQVIRSINNAFNTGLLVSSYFWTNHTSDAGPFIDESLEKYPYSEFVAYQSHRILLWNGEYDKARRVARVIKGIELPGENNGISKIRQLCADKENERALNMYDEYNNSYNVYKGINNDAATQWISLKTLGRDEEANKITDTFYEQNELLSLSAFLYYPYFDYTRYPKLVSILEAENHKRGPVIDIPFRCGR